jgi:hypothetical protein
MRMYNYRIRAVGFIQIATGFNGDRSKSFILWKIDDFEASNYLLPEIFA